MATRATCLLIIEMMVMRAICLLQISLDRVYMSQIRGCICSKTSRICSSYHVIIENNLAPDNFSILRIKSEISLDVHFSQSLLQRKNDFEDVC